MQQVLDIFKEPCSQKGLGIEFSVDERVPETLLVDGQRIRQVFVNLMQNSIKFTYQGTIRLHLDYDHSSKFLIGRVKDTGIGVSEEDQATLFKIFGKLQRNKEQFTSGIGLGLHICKQICEKFKGQIKIEDSSSEHGTTFVFTFQTSGPATDSMVHSLRGARGSRQTSQRSNL